jgi:hypothetical protein
MHTLNKQNIGIIKMVKFTPASAPVVKAAATQVVVSEEALLEACASMTEATESLLSAQVAGIEIDQCMSNLSMAVEAFSAEHGFNKQNLAIFNGENELTACLGMESIAALESYGAYQIAGLEAEFVKKLGEKSKEYWAKFIAWLKNLWVKVVDFFKSMFTFRARLGKSLLDAKLTNPEVQAKFNGDKVITQFKAADVNKMVEFVKKLEDEIIAKINTGKFEGVEDYAKELETIEGFKKEADKKASELGWSAAEVAKAATFANQYVIKGPVTAASKVISAELKKLVDRAGAAANMEADKAKAEKEAISKRRDDLNKCLAVIRRENRVVAKVASIYWSVYKSCYTK